MTNKTVDFTKEVFEFLKKLAASNKSYRELDEEYDLWADDLGRIEQGAVCCDLTLLYDPGFKEDKDNFCIGSGFAIDAKYFLLGKDTDYGEIKGVPYDCVMGFYGYLKDTYEETLNGLSEQFDNCLKESEDLVKGINESELTWDKVESYEGDIYPGYSAA